MSEETQTQEQPVETQEVQETQPQVSEAEIKKRNEAEYNWAQARRKMQELENQNVFLHDELNKMKTQSAPQEVEIGDTDIATGADVKRLARKMAREIADQVIREREIATVDDRLQNKYSDYNEVVNKENIELLKQTDPEIAKSLMKLADDPYEQGVVAYKWMKKLGLSEEKQPLEKKKAIANASKPMSTQSIGASNSPLGNAHMFENGLTPELKAQLQREMKDAIKRG